jgi:hypothetical protein
VDRCQRFLVGIYSERQLIGARRPNLTRLSALLRTLQNDAAPMIIDNSPFLDLLQGSKAAEADKTIVQAAISYAWGLSGTIDITH